MTAIPAKEVTTRQVAAVGFSFYSDEEVRKLSVKRIIQPVIFDNLRNPVPGGLYDPALGPLDNNGRCATCGLGGTACPGHFGHVELPVPAYNPMIFSMLYRLLRLQCHSCYHFRMEGDEVRRFELKLALLASGRLVEALELQVAQSSLPKELTQMMEDCPAPCHHSSPSPSASPSLMTSHVLEAVQDTITEFFSRMPKDRCKNCEAYSPNIKKQGATRLFKVWGSAKALLANRRLGKSCAGVLDSPAKAAEGLSSVEAEMARQLAEEQQRRQGSAKKGGDSHRPGGLKRGRAGADNTKPAADAKDNAEALDNKRLKQGLEEEEDEEEEEEEEDKGVMQYLPSDQELGKQLTEEPTTPAKGKKAAGAARKALQDAAEASVLAADLRPKFMTSLEAEDLLRRLWRQEWALLSLIFGPGGIKLLGGGPPGPGEELGSNAGWRGRRANVPGMKIERVEGGKGEQGVWQGLRVVWDPELAPRLQQGYAMFFLRSLPVAPNKFRPPSMVGGEMFEHPQNLSLQRILTACLELSSLAATQPTEEQLANVVRPEEVRQQELARMLSQWLALQDAVSCLMDSTLSDNKGADVGVGIRQALEKKEGLFRKNMMGKRVNFAARSVISPDPYIGCGEIGVPPYFAKRLCFPERVTPWNVERLRQAVIRGADELNGAVAVEDERGRIVALKLCDATKRAALAKALLSSSASVPGSVAPATTPLANATPGIGGTPGGVLPPVTLLASDVLGKASGAATGPGAVPGRTLGLTAPNKIVYRHLQDGDLMLTNRQPTLHKPGLMAHRARVLKGEKTIRMHYANCATFNADFDGDEINLHMPQDQLGRAEGYTIVHADHQFIVPTDGKPIRGLIQDHVVSGVLLTRRDTWLTRDEYAQLVYIACSAWARPGTAIDQDGPKDMLLDPPTIWKPRMLWSGKQVVAAAVAYYTRGLPPLTFSAAGKVPPDYWGKNSGEADLVFHKGYLVAGCVDKGVFGKFGLVHAMQELYGDAVAGKILSSFSRLFTGYLQWYGFTCGFDDLLLTAPTEAKRKALLSRAEALAVRASAEFVGQPLPEEWAVGPNADQHLNKLLGAEVQVRAALSERYRSNRDTGKAHDMKGSGTMHPLSSEVVKACLPSGQVKSFPTNCLSLMTISGAKGSLVNFSQISCLLGQQELEGRRVPRMASGKTLPCFAPYDAGARSCGFVGDRFLSGLRPQEYYFHCMAGREGLIDTTVKTSRSGYLQRCMVKNLETLRVHYDASVRDNADGSIVQFYYGEDGLDVTQVSYMAQLGFLAANAPRFAQVVGVQAAASCAQACGLTGQEGEVRRAIALRGKHVAALAAAKAAGDAPGAARAQAKLAKQLPVMATHPPSLQGAVSEAFADRVTRYLALNPDAALQRPPGHAATPPPAAPAPPDPGQGQPTPKKDKKGKKASREVQAEQLAAQVALAVRLAKADRGKPEGREFEAMMHLKFMRALAAPGEAVGVVAAQSIGEPSTQMTLNTFHMAGRGEANVTLGIPRLREILMTAAQRIKTPVMTVPLKTGCTASDAHVLAARMRRLRLAECLAGISLRECPCVMLESSGSYGRSYTITLRFFSPDQFPPESGLSWLELVAVFKSAFASRLKTEIDKEVKKKGGRGAGASLSIGRLDTSVLGTDDEAAAGARGAAGVDEEGESSARQGGRRGSRPQEELDEDDEDEDENQEKDEAMAEGKTTLRGSAGDETSYGAPDAEDEEVAASAQRATAHRDLARLARPGQNAEEDEDEDASEDNNSGDEGNAQTPNIQTKPAAKSPVGRAGAAGTPGTAAATATARPPSAADAQHQLDRGLAAISDLDDGVDMEHSECRITVALPLHAPKLLMLEIVERTAAAVMVRSTPGIDKVYVLAGDRGQEGPRVQTDGINFEGVWAHEDLVDLTRITTNDVGAMLRTYGVEAARATILREAQSVFAAYGIGVDPRHLGLIADFMTHQGGYRACNRIGIESSVSPFLKMSFETAAHFLTDATLRSAEDDLRTPSARLCVGRVVELGTGVMGVMQQLGQPKQGNPVALKQLAPALERGVAQAKLSPLHEADQSRAKSGRKSKKASVNGT